jgi:hypothetical protein
VYRDTTLSIEHCHLADARRGVGGHEGGQRLLGSFAGPHQRQT